MKVARGRMAALLAAALAGCASIDAPMRLHLESPSPETRACAEWFRDMDRRVDAAGVRDAQDARIPGFPYLRATRLHAALRPLAQSDPYAMQALADRMLSLDMEARQYEMLNLPGMSASDVRAALERGAACGRRLRDADLASEQARGELLARIEVPDDYRTVNRILGLYAFTRIAFASGVRRYEEETRAAFAAAPAVPGGAILTRHAPPAESLMTRARAAIVLDRAAQNPLRIPEPSESELAELLAAYAPSFEIPVGGDYDRFGALRWLRGADMPVVDASQHVVYAHPAWTHYQDRVLLQLVYTIWFPERPPQSPGDLLAGHLDGITWRVTLAPDGEPLVYDAIHPCGCYHMFFPTPRAQALPAPDGIEEWMFSPQSLPRVGDGERPVVRIASGTHAIERVSIVKGSDSLARYELLPYGELRSLTRIGGPRAGIFDTEGLVPGSERPERYLFWPMGIASAGAMRQWGRQATAFVGRRHFDDADLFEKRFRLDLR
jgi:hypothetical protein